MRNGWARLGGVLGIVYCVVGFFLIFLGWNGAATYDRVEAQIPYVVSGGIAGLGLVVVGAALLVAQSLRGDRVELRAAIDELRQSVERLGAGGGATTAGATTELSGDTVVAGPTSYHRPTCRVVQGQLDVVVMARSEAAASDRTPCRICTPDEPTLTAAS